MRLPLLLIAISSIMLGATMAQSYGVQAGTCSPTGSIPTHNASAVGTGNFVLSATKGGFPVASITPGDTVQVSLSRTSGTYRGFLVRANDGAAAGPTVGGFSVTSGLQQLASACSPVDSGVTQTSNIVRTSDGFDWTAPLALTPGTDVVLSAFPVVDISEWYGGATPITLTLTVAAPVPMIGPWAWLLVGSAIALISVVRLRRA